MAEKSKTEQSTKSPLPQSHRLILEIRDSKSVLICQHCDRPILEIVEGDIEIQSKHGPSLHRNVLSVEYLRMLAFEMIRQKGPPDNWLKP